MKFINCDITNYGIIGDIHADIKNLNHILNIIDIEKRNKVISLGDIWDRGQEPNEVVSVLYDLYKRNVLIPIVGNHELKYIRYFTDPASKVSMGTQQQATLNLLTNESIAKFVELYESEIVCIYDPKRKIFITHAPGGRPQRILYKNYENTRIVMGGQANITFDEFLNRENHTIHKKHISTLMYGITNGDKTSDGFPVRMPIIDNENDDLDGWTYIYGHIHAATFNPELNNRCICLDFCSPTGKIGGCIVNADGSFNLIV